MRCVRSLCSTIALVAALLAAIVAQPASAAPSDAVIAEQSRVIELVNVERASVGLAPLAPNDRLTEAAIGYANTMAAQNHFSHTGKDGSSVRSRAEAAGYLTWTFLGENLAAGQKTPERVVAAWMSSPGHRANILAADATEVGLGHVQASGSSYSDYWALEFGAQW